MLQLCVSQQISEKPYTFQSTGIRVYSIEEALYHVYHYWQESAEEFSSTKLIAWVDTLGAPALATRITAIAKIEPFSRRMISFLGIVEYFSEAELTSLQADLKAWEHRGEWERLKHRADRLVTMNEPARALPLYRRALNLEENHTLLNNMAIANMKLGRVAEAAKLLAKAHALQPDSLELNLHYAEAAILNGDFEKAATLLKSVQVSHPTSADILFLRGLMAYHKKDYYTAIDWLEKAKALDNRQNFRYSRKIATCYIQQNQHDKAIASLDKADPEYYVKTADIYASQGHAHIPEAIRHMRQAISQATQDIGGNEAALWTKLARYYRTDYDWQRANEAITHALAKETPPSDTTLLENARIQKGLGRMRDYRAGLGEVLKVVKERYRGEER